MRVGAAWRDARILNLSSRGLMIKAERAAAAAATTLELRRGRHVIIARVMWTPRPPLRAAHAGRAADRGDHRRARPVGGAPDRAGQRAPRRARGAGPAPTAHEESRWRSRAWEYRQLWRWSALSCAGLAYGAVTQRARAPAGDGRKRAVARSRAYRPVKVARALFEERRDALAIVGGEAQAAHLVALEVEFLVERAFSRGADDRLDRGEPERGQGRRASPPARRLRRRARRRRRISRSGPIRRLFRRAAARRSARGRARAPARRGGASASCRRCRG